MPRPFRRPVRAPWLQIRWGVAVVALAASPVMAHAAAPSAAADCTALAGKRFGNATVLSAETSEAGKFKAPAGAEKHPAFVQMPAFCRVHGVARPVPGSEIGFDVWLPQKQWSRRLHMIGNAGYSSSIYWPQLADQLRRGDVAVATDTGHSGSDLRFVIDRPEALTDFAFRAVHESVVAAKAVTSSFYGEAPRHSYFTGCSTGGYQALSEAQRYPEDFDGIIAGAPGNNRTRLTLSFLWEFQANHRPGDARPILPNEKLPMLTRAVVRRCDALDGVRDGVIGDPEACRFDPAEIQCSKGDGPECLTAEQVETVRRIYAGPRHLGTGAAIYPGMSVGSEGVVGDPDELPGWGEFWANAKTPGEPERADFFRHWVFKDPNWSWERFDWNRDVDEVERRLGWMDAVNPDLDRFRARGGKLIMFMGWQDPVGAAKEAINYYDDVVERSSAADRQADTQDFLRLYMMPGLAHCSGGPGATQASSQMRDGRPPVSDRQHDMVLALHHWVETGQAPEEIIATRFEDPDAEKRKIAFQRPLCVYPKLAVYVRGPTNRASSFACRLRK